MKRDRLHTVMHLPLRILSPVHVGAGNERTWQRALDFTTSGKKVYVFDQEKLFEQLLGETTAGGMNGLDAYLDRISKAHRNRIDILLDELDIDFEAIQSLSFDYKYEPENEIRPLIRTGEGIPYLPGSSIKGALRSILFHHMWNREGKNARDKDMDNRLLGSFERAITRYIAPSDVVIHQTELTNVALFNLQKQGFDWKSYYGSKGQQKETLLSVETFAVGAEGSLRLSIADGWLQMIEEAAQTPLYREKAEGKVHNNAKYIIRKENPVQYLLRLVNEYTREHLRREIAFFEAFPQAEHTDFIIHHLREWKSKTENNGRSCILRLGYGSGYHGITGDYWFSDHVDVVNDPERMRIYGKEEDFHFKSRRIAKEDILTAACMGFVELFLPEHEPDIPFQPILPIDETQKSTSSIAQKSKPIEKPAYLTPYAKIVSGTVFQAEILEIGKPFSKVKLLIEEYPFDPVASLSGTKKVQLRIGMIVEVVVNSRSQIGEIKQVTYWKT